MTTSTRRTAQDVLLFIPNLLGYGRVASAIASFVVMIVFPQLWMWAIVLYLANFVGDLFDGIVARRYGQTSKFGGVLDMVTDRCSTLGLLFVLAGEYAAVDAQLFVPAFRLTFLTLMILDISSHWCQMYSSLSVGLHHKSDQGNADRNFLVRWFYGYYW
jgi:CDP-diacylglycerol--inositol 3-phosphatidyltransferase